MDGQTDLNITAKKNNGEIIIQAAASKACAIRLVNVTGVTASGASIRADGNDTIVTPTADRIEIKPEK